MTFIKIGGSQEYSVAGVRARNRFAIVEKVGRLARRLVAEYWIAILVISLCVLIAVNGRQSPSLSLWLFALVATLAAFLLACGRLYSDFKINSHIIQARLGLCPPTASPHYVRALFDGYAEDFDHHLMVELSYQAPNLIVNVLSEHVHGNTPVIADLGCGTGLCGPLIARYADELIGVDLSPKMLQFAERKNCYDSLVEADVVDFLKRRRKSIDVCVAADVLVYFGDLEAVLAGAFKALRDDGLFAFTVEATTDEDWFLQPTGRYAHSTDYVKRMAQKLGFQVVELKRAILRTQAGASVLGDVWLLKKCSVKKSDGPGG